MEALQVSDYEPIELLIDGYVVLDWHARMSSYFPAVSIYTAHMGQTKHHQFLVLVDV